DVRDARAREFEGLPEALLGLTQRALRLFAPGDVDDRADEAGDLAVCAVEGRLVVDRGARAGARLDLDLVALAARTLPEFVVHGLVLGGDPRALRIKITYPLADEVLACDAEEFFPRAVYAEIAAVARLEEHGNRQHVDQLLRETFRLGQIATGLRKQREHRMRQAVARGGRRRAGQSSGALRLGHPPLPVLNFILNP